MTSLQYSASTFISFEMHHTFGIVDNVTAHINSDNIDTNRINPDSLLNESFRSSIEEAIFLIEQKKTRVIASFYVSSRTFGCTFQLDSAIFIHA